MKMFYWMKPSGSDALDVSKAEILRGVVAEKLTTAAQEILAVVERTVSGYEEEAAGLRRQLEALLQPRVQLERRALGSDVEAHHVVVVSEEEEEEDEEQAGVGDAGSLGLLWYDEAEGDSGDEEQQLSERPETSSRQRREDLKDPDYQINSRLSSPRVQSDRRKPGRPRVRDTQSHLDLRICILDDSHTDVLSKRVFQKCPVQELRCPRGLQEADFLQLLSSTFPQLSSQPFDVFTSDRSRRLQPLSVKTLTPEELHRSISATGYSALYIRLKSSKEVQTQTHVDLRIYVLEDSRIDVLSPSVFKKYAVHELQCPCGLQEADFLELLSSTFPQLSRQPFDVFTSDRSRRLQPLSVKTLTPEEVTRSISATGYSALYIRLKAQEEVQSGEAELHGADAASDQTRLNRSSGSQRDDTQSEGADGQAGGPSAFSGLRSLRVRHKSRGGAAEVSDAGRNSDRGQEHLRESGRVERWGVGETRASDDGDALQVCKVCPALRASTNMLIKHAWSHVDDPERLCGVCGEQAESAEQLRSHLHRHQRTHSCNICGKSFLSVNGFNGHVARHKGTKPYKCKICHKAFAQKWVLKSHKWVHAADKPHKCDLCPKAFASEVELERHRLSHTGLHHCTICNKSLSSTDTFSKHMVRHRFNATRPTTFTCDVCSKTFNANQKLRVHMRVHAERKCPVCHMVFSHRRLVRRHMKTHQNGPDVSARILCSGANGTTRFRRVR